MVDHGQLRDGLLPHPSEPDLVIFASYLGAFHRSKAGATVGLSPSTVRAHLTAVGDYFVDHRFPNPLHEPGTKQLTRLLYKCVRGMGKENGKPRKAAKALTTDKLRIVVGNAKGPKHVLWETDMLVSMTTLAVYGLLRAGEFTHSHVKEQGLDRNGDARPPVHDPAQHVCWRHVNFFRDGSGKLEFMTINIPSSKCDAFRQGSLRTLYATDTLDCPVEAMWRYRQSRLRDRESHGQHAHADDPLYVLPNGHYVTKTWFQTNMQAALYRGGVTDAYTTHSCRAGGATSMLLAGMPGELVQIMGRWSSDAYRRYLDMSPASLAAVTRGMSLIQPDDVRAGRKAAEEQLDRVRSGD